MRALTLRQPWSWAVAHAGKRVENRTPVEETPVNDENNNPPPEFDAVMLRQCTADMKANGGFVWPAVGFIGEDGFEPNVAYVVHDGRLVKRAVQL